MALGGDLLEAVQRADLDDQRTATDAAALVAAAAEPPSAQELAPAMAAALTAGRSATVRALIGCGAQPAPEALHIAAALEDGGAAVGCVEVLIEAGLPLDCQFERATPLESAATAEAALLLAREGALVRNDVCAAHAVAGRISIADALAAGVVANPTIAVRPPEQHRHHWAHAALASLRKVPGSAEGVMLRRESERLVTISAQLSTRLRDKGAECERLVAENEKLQNQLVEESSAKGGSASSQDGTVYMDTTESAAAAGQWEEVSAQKITIAALRDELEELRSRADEDVLNMSAVKDSAAADADAASRQKIESLSNEVRQLQSAAADAVGQLHKASEAVVEQRERARRADSALAEVESAHRETKTELGERDETMASMQEDNERQLRELQALAAAVRELEVKQLMPSSPATKEQTPPREAGTMLARARKELPPSARPKLLEVLQSIDREETGWLESREFQFGLQMAGCVLSPEEVGTLVQELGDGVSVDEVAQESQVSISRFMEALGGSGPPGAAGARTPSKAPSSTQPLADTCIRLLLDYTAQSKTTVKMYLNRYTGGSGDSAGELRVSQLQAALRSAGESLEPWQVKQLMGELLVLSGSCTPEMGASGLSASLERISIGRVLDGVKQWRRQQALSHNGTPPMSARRQSMTATRGWNGGTPASTRPGATPARRNSVPGSSAKLRMAASPNASGALFAQLEELTAECTSKDMDIRRLTTKLTAATAAADSESVRQGMVTPAQVEAMVAQAVKTMGMKEEHLHDELEALEQKLSGVQRKVDKCQGAVGDQQQSPDGIAAQILAEAAKTVEGAEAELVGYKAEHARQMEQVSNLNDELNREAKKLRSSLDHAFKERDKLNEGHSKAIAQQQAENKSLKSRIGSAGGDKRKDAEVSELRMQLKAKDRTLEEQEAALQESRSALAKAKKAATTFKEKASAQQTSKVHQQLSEAERKVAELTESEASLKKLLDARQRGLSHAIERVTRQDKELSAARAALKTKTGGGGSSGKGDVHRDAWLGEGRALAIGDRCALLAEHDDDHQEERLGEVVFLGPTDLGDGVWAGVSLDQALGRHDGRVKGRRYFDCRENHGVLVRPSKLRRTEPAAAERGGERRGSSASAEEEGNKALVDAIMSMQGSLREAENSTKEAIVEAEVAKKARRAVEKLHKDAAASFQIAKDERDEMDGQYKGLKRELDHTVRQLRGVQQSQDDVNTAVNEENSTLGDQLKRMKARAERLEGERDRANRMQRAADAAKEQVRALEAEVSTLRARNERLCDKAEALAILEGEAEATVEHAERLGEENEALRQRVESMEMEEEERLAGGSLTNHVRSRLEHELSVIRLQQKGTVSQLHMVQDRLKTAEKELHTARMAVAKGGAGAQARPLQLDESFARAAAPEPASQPAPASVYSGAAAGGGRSVKMSQQKRSIMDEVAELRKSLAQSGH